jgi:hypothetical protein
MDFRSDLFAGADARVWRRRERFFFWWDEERCGIPCRYYKGEKRIVQKRCRRGRTGGGTGARFSEGELAATGASPTAVKPLRIMRILVAGRLALMYLFFNLGDLAVVRNL